MKQKTVKHIRELWSDRKGKVIVVNCSGLGAHFLGGVQDKSVYPTRGKYADTLSYLTGQTVIVHAPHIKHTITLGNENLLDPDDTTQRQEAAQKFAYIIPRQSGACILGGTFEEDNWNMEVDPRTTEEITKRCLEICPELKIDGEPLQIVCSNVGLRPTRHGGIRLEAEKVGNSVLLIHNYGHGGYGYQSSWGTASSVLQLCRKRLCQSSKL